MDVIKYPKVLEDISKIEGVKKNLLLGNGFSTVFAPDVFGYDSLFNTAKQSLSSRMKEVFERAGETNFERALRLYDDAIWLAQVYQKELGKTIEHERDEIRNLLIQAILDNHPDDQSFMTKEAREKAYAFLKQYSNIFTTNYDLILYWISMQEMKSKGSWDDGFRKRDGILCFTGFEDSSRIYYIHGALHYVRSGSFLKKLSWSIDHDRLKTLITSSITNGDYPVFVAEGRWDKKQSQIENDFYLRSCFDALNAMHGVLVVFGHSLNPDFDRHILERILNASNLERIYFGVFGDNPQRDYSELLKFVSRHQSGSKFTFFQSETVGLG